MTLCPTCGRHDTTGTQCGVCAGYRDAYRRLDAVHHIDGGWCTRCGWTWTDTTLCAACDESVAF